MKAPGKPNRATAAHIPDGVSSGMPKSLLFKAFCGERGGG